jgi:hypothetical protein
VKKILFLGVVIMAGGIAAACVTNPLTGKSTMALVDNSELFPSSFREYEQFLAEHQVVTGTPEARMVVRAGARIREAAYRNFFLPIHPTPPVSGNCGRRFPGQRRRRPNSLSIELVPMPGSLGTVPVSGRAR